VTEGSFSDFGAQVRDPLCFDEPTSSARPLASAKCKKRSISFDYLVGAEEKSGGEPEKLDASFELHQTGFHRP
jgi:hypothetical protein